MYIFGVWVFSVSVYLACHVLGAEESIGGRAELGGASLQARRGESSCGTITPSSLCSSFPLSMRKHSGAIG